MNEQIYLALLWRYIYSQFLAGKLDDPQEKKSYSRALWDAANDLIRQGVFGTERQFELPYFTEMSTVYVDFQENIPTELSELEEKLAKLPLEKFDYQKQQDALDRLWQETSLASREKMTAYEKAQIDLARQRLELESREPSLREQRLQFELDRQRSLASLGTAYSDPSGWIKRWQLQNMPNPFDAYIPSLQEQAYIGSQQLEAARQAYQATTGAYEKAGSPWIPMTPEAAQFLKVSMESAGAIAQQRALVQAGEGGQPTGVPKTPPVPAWLSQFVPSQKIGQPVTAGTIPTPSGQLWARTPWSQREMLRGYAEFAGGRPYEDIIGSMYSMFPREPRGAGSQRWLPARR